MTRNSNKIPVAQLSEAVQQTLQQYVDDIADGTDEAADKVSKQALKEIRSGSPVKSGKYKKGWTRDKEGGRGQVGYIIHNKYPGMPHLLEKGHANVNGGRTPGRPHIAPAEEKAVEEFQSAVEELIRNAGG